jgi:enoyl-CoA hydratase/carnithine racemase
VYDEILYEVGDPVATITLNRPDSMNGWTDRMGREVRHAVARAEADAAVVGIVITGAGRAFCAGADLKVLSSISSEGRMASDAGDLPPAPEPAPRPPDLDGEYTYLLGCPKPIVAAINGACAGMAVPIALSCDIRFMAEDAVILTAFAQRGLIAEWGLSWLLPRVVGGSHAMDLLISSRKVSGTEAAAMGLVNKAVPADQVLAHSQEYVRDLAARCSPTSISVMKRQLHAQLHAGLGPAELESRRLMVESFGRPDFKEGVQSFLEKRPPTFPRIGS